MIVVFGFVNYWNAFFSFYSEKALKKKFWREMNGSDFISFVSVYKNSMIYRMTSHLSHLFIYFRFLPRLQHP